MAGMKSKTVLVTGGAGFIGSSLVDKLLDQGKKVVVIDDFNDYYSPSQKVKNIISAKKNRNYVLIKGDIRSINLMDEAFSKYQFETVIHLAARAGVRPSLTQAKLYWDTNVMGTLNLLETMNKYQVKRMIFASSSSVYGNRGQGPFKETDNTDKPVSPYGASKKAMEALCHSYAHVFGIHMAGLRFFTVYGPRNRPDMACFLFTDAIAKNIPITQFGDGNSGRDYTYIDDIVSGIIKAEENIDRFRFELLNLGNSSPIKLKSLIEVIEKILDKKAAIKKQEINIADVLLTYADNTKAKKLIGWTPKTTIHEGMQGLVEWYKSNLRKKLNLEEHKSSKT